MSTSLERPAESSDGTGITPRLRQPISSWLYFRHEMQSFLDRMWDHFQRNPPTPLDEFPQANDRLGLDIMETESEITLRADVPGLTADEIHVEVSGNVLTVRGASTGKSDGDIYTHERMAGGFFRSVTLPDYVDADKTDAHLSKGVLTIHVPRIPGVGPKRIPVRS